MPPHPAIAALHADMIVWRQDFHNHPELGFQENRTASLIAGKLEQWGFQVHRGLGGTGVVGTLDGHGAGGGKVVGLRADMDALEMTETTGLPYASSQPGVFHGCGHDGHMAMLLGAARHLSDHRDFSGRVQVIFQPAEEKGAGACRMVDDGLFRLFPCDEIYALHTRPSLAFGHVAVRTGAMMASADQFRARIVGRGGHAAHPHVCCDPVVVAAQLILAWQTLVSRSTDPLDSAVISVTQLQAGTTHNVIPGEAHLAGTIRALRPQTRHRLHQQMTHMAAGIGDAFGVSVGMEYMDGYPMTLNHPAQAGYAARRAASVVGADKVHTDLPPSMGAEDFAFMLQSCPGAYLWLGQGEEKGENVPLHNPCYQFNDHLLPIGASLLAALVTGD